MTHIHGLPAPSLDQGVTTPLTRYQAEATIEALIAYLDALDGDPDTEVDDEDCCETGDDIGTASARFRHNSFGPGDPDDAEDDDPLEYDL